jgi:hypothetical protein
MRGVLCFDFESLSTIASATTRRVRCLLCTDSAKLQGDLQGLHFHERLSLKLKHFDELAEGNTESLRWRMRGHATHGDDSLSEFLQMRGIRHVCCALEATTTRATTEDRRQPAVVVARRGLGGERHHRCVQNTPTSGQSSCDVRHKRF